MQAGVGLLVSDVMPIYMIIPRYSHNYAQFCQLLNSNLFTHRKYLCSREKPLVKPMAPGSIFHHINLPTLSYFYCRLFYFASLFTLYYKNTKNIILSYLSDLTLVSGRVGIDNRYSRWLRGLFVLCKYEGLARSLLLDWYLGSQKLREILTLLCCIILSSSGKSNAVLKR